MYWENVVFDAIDPQAVGRFWEGALGTEPLTDEEAGYETRLAAADGPVLDLCFQKVPEPPEGPQRLRLELRGGADHRSVVERLLARGASRADSGGARHAVLADPEGNPFTVLGSGAADDGVGPVAAVALEVADPDRARDFWSWLTGWAPAEGDGPGALRHPSGRGPVLELRREAEPKSAGKNRIHLDVRLEPGDDADAVAAEVAARGGRELHPGWGDLPWRTFVDPSGNEFCVLPSPG